MLYSHNMKKAKAPPETLINTYPMRINKYLAHKGVATRTGVDELIRHQKILINGKIAKLGDKVLETDKVEVRGNVRIEIACSEYVACCVIKIYV